MYRRSQQHHMTNNVEVDNRATSTLDRIGMGGYLN